MAEIILTKRTFRLNGFTPVLGSQPADPDIRERYLMEKAREQGVEVDPKENEYLPNSIEEKGLTVFLRDPTTKGGLYIQGYVIKGMLKESLNTLKSQTGLAAPKGKIDSLIFVSPDKLVFHRDGKPIMETSGVNSRPLRAETMQGPRVALAASEQIDAPWTLELTLKLIDNQGSKRSEPLNWDIVETALNYGKLKGLGQWRNAAYGSFTWDDITEEVRKIANEPMREYLSEGFLVERKLPTYMCVTLTAAYKDYLEWYEEEGYDYRYSGTKKEFEATLLQHLRMPR